MLVPWCAWLLSSTLKVLRLRLRLRTFYGSIKQLSCLSVLFYLGPFCLGPFCRGYFVESGHFVCVFYKNNKKHNKSFFTSTTLLNISTITYAQCYAYAIMQTIV